MSWKRPNGMHVIRESEANESIGEVYNDIKSSLSLPQVPLFFQMCAAGGGFLPQFWEAVKPAVRTSAFMTSAQRLRADAYTRIHNYFEIPAAFGTSGPAAPPELAATIELFHYEGGLLLLLLSLAAEAFDNPIGQHFVSRAEGSPQPAGFVPILVEEGTLAPETRKILNEARRQYGLGVVPMEFRALAAWPNFLNQHWQLWKQMAQSPILVACEHQLLLHSIELAHALPGPMEMSSASLRQNGMDDKEFSSIIRVTHNWNRASAMLLLQISAAKISMEGGSGYMRIKKKSGQERAA
jgi:hypothetical protein